ncbi:glial fibrillary acidic protein-like [Cucumis melo var. makuwa]|uniref:Glial fibrillary acidic protein-like n=1 Tax=Cucumis melo var. makuwa TaxID=1194695 RepID=A0A5D3C8B8_CUCMM|nr:glial fibrillary acidic protein-like [Cucumis melo var. makuwa]
MNCVLATENEKLREEVKKWVQQAVNTQSYLDEAKRKRLELEKENDSLNTEAIQVRKKNKRLLRNITNLHEEIEAKKVCITDLKHEVERLNGVALEFQNALHEQATSSQQTAIEIEVQAVRQDIEGLKDQLAKILELLTTGRGKSVAETSSQVEVDLNQVLENMPAYPPGFTPQRSSNPRMVDRTYPTSFSTPNPNTTTQQAAHASNPISIPIMEGGKKLSEEQGSRKRLEFQEERLSVIEGPFAYKDNHAVPWKYECQFIMDNVVSATVGGITCSGRCYTLDNLKYVFKEDEVLRRKGKAIEMADEDDLNDLSKVFTEKITLIEKETDHEVVSKEETCIV